MIDRSGSPLGKRMLWSWTTGIVSHYCQCAQYPRVVHFKMVHCTRCKFDFEIKTSEAESAPSCVGGLWVPSVVVGQAPGPGPGFLTPQYSCFSRLTSHAGSSPAPQAWAPRQRSACLEVAPRAPPSPGSPQRPGGGVPQRAAGPINLSAGLA